MRLLVALFLLGTTVLLAQPGQPSQPTPASGRLKTQNWETLTLDDAPAGVIWTYVREVGEGAQLRRTQVQDLKLTLKRGSSTIELRQEHGLEEDSEGKVVGLFLRQYQGGKIFLELQGKVDPATPDRLEITRDGKTSRQPWYEDTFRPGDLDRMPGKVRWQPGDTGVIRLYEPTYNRVVRYDATALEKETLTVEGQRLSLTPLKLVPEPLVGGTQRITLSTIRWWLDEQGQIRRRELDMPGLGLFVLSRSPSSDKAPALAAPAVDVLERGLVPMDRATARPYTTTAARLRLTLKGVADSATALKSDDHQTVKEIRPGVLDVVIHPVGDQPRSEASPAAEYLASESLLDWRDPAVQALRTKLGAGPRDAWERAQERANWVRRNLRVDNGVTLAPASQVARDLRGDCRQAALLTTALCRADGLPARTAIGLVYIERNRRPFLGFHMWTEVFVNGGWRGLDGTPGIGAVGALHLKVTDASWHKETTLAPLQPALNLVGKLNVEVLEIVE